MGSFYANVTLLGTTVDDVRQVAPRPAFVAVEDDAVLVFAAEDEGSPQSGERLSAALRCIAVSVTIHDDDILFIEVHDRGRSVVGGAVPDPAEYFEFGDSVPAPDPGALVGAVQRGDVDAVRAALVEDFVFATERHEAVAMALRLPLAAVGWGYGYLLQNADLYAGPPLTKL